MRPHIRDTPGRTPAAHGTDIQPPAMRANRLMMMTKKTAFIADHFIAIESDDAY